MKNHNNRLHDLSILSSGDDSKEASSGSSPATRRDAFGLLLGPKLETAVRVVYSDESVGKEEQQERLTVVAGLMLNMDVSWNPVRDAIELAIQEALMLTDISTYEIKGKSLYHQIRRGDQHAAKLMRLLLAIPRQQLVPVFYEAVDHAGLEFTEKSMRVGPPKEKYIKTGQPFTMAVGGCMERIDTYVHQGFPSEQVLWIHDSCGLNDHAKETLRSFRSYRHYLLEEEAEDAPMGDEEYLQRESQISHIADMMYFGDSKESRALQLADVCSTTIMRYLRNEPGIEPFYEILQSQIVNRGTRPLYEGAEAIIRRAAEVRGKT